MSSHNHYIYYRNKYKKKFDIGIGDKKRLFSGGYLFLQRIYHDLGIDRICKNVAERRKFEFDIDSILSRLIYGRIIFPASKLATYELSKKFFEQPNFENHHMYRALEVIGEETDFIQAELYKRSTKVIDRKTGVLYYDCTNHHLTMYKHLSCAVA